MINRLFRRRSRRAPLQSPGRVTAFQPHERGLSLTCERGAFRLTVIAPDCIQVRYQFGGKFDVPFSYAVAKVTWPEVQFKIAQTDQSFLISTTELVCEINRADARFTFMTPDGQVIAGDAAPIAVSESGEVRLTRALPADEGCYGLAAQPVNLDVRGKRYPFWNTDPNGGVSRNQIPIYYAIPFYLGVGSAGVNGLFWDNSHRGWVDVGAENPSHITFSAEGGELRYYQFASATVFNVLSRYTELTGRMPLPPLWALGFHLSRFSYSPAEQVREIAKELRNRNIPCDALYLDIDYMDGFRVFTWHPQKFAAPAVLLGDLKDMGFKVVAILDPGVKIDPNYRVYQSGQAEDIFLRTAKGKPFVGSVWAGESVFPDFTSPKARAWWASQFEALIRPGIAGIWNDMNEPALFGKGKNNQMPDDVQHDFEGRGAKHLEAHNLYGMLMGRASREALEKARPDKRPFNITRAAHAGAQRYASTWTGDNASTWDQLRLSISMCLNSGLAGMSFNGPDVGGFYGNCEPELYARWMQLGAMLPFFRVHTSVNTSPQEPWAFGQPYEDIARKAIEMRYRLLPYFYSTFAQCAQHGWPILRPLFLLDPSDPELRKVEDAFLVGESLLVAPVLNKGQTEREFYLPHGRWYDYYTGKAYAGGKKVQLAAPLDHLPILVPAGHVIPLYPLQQYTGQTAISELQLKIYHGDGEITLYEDEGEGKAYQNGMYRWLYFTCKVLTNGGLSVAWRRAGKYQPTYERVRCEVYGFNREPEQVLLDNSTAPLYYFENGVVEFTANKPFEQAKIILSEPVLSESTILRSPFKDKS